LVSYGGELVVVESARDKIEQLVSLERPIRDVERIFTGLWRRAKDLGEIGERGGIFSVNIEKEDACSTGTFSAGGCDDRSHEACDGSRLACAGRAKDCRVAGDQRVERQPDHNIFGARQRTDGDLIFLCAAIDTPEISFGDYMDVVVDVWV